MFHILLQAMLPPSGATPNALNGSLGACLDSLIVYGEKMVWGGVTATGEQLTGASNHLVGLAAGLGAIFAVCLAGKMAYQSMTEGKPIDVLDLLKPIMIAFILANWYAVAGGIYSIFRPVENRFRSVYVWSNERVDSLRDRRLLLKEVVQGEIEEAEAEAIMSEIRQRRGVEEKEEEEEEIQIVDGDATQQAMAESYTDAHFGDILNSDVSGVPEEDKQGNFSLTDLLNQAKMFHWAEDAIMWIGEVIWAVCIYVVFLAKYLSLYVLVMFGPIFFACSILETWETAWSGWIGKYATVCLYGTMAYLALIFGLMIIEASTVADINIMEYAMLDDDRFVAYVKKTGMLDGFAQLTMYVMAVVVTAVSIPLSFELAGNAFPGEGGKAAANFFNGMINYIKEKSGMVEQYAERKVKKAVVKAAVNTAVTATTGVAALGAVIADKLAERNEREMEREHEAEREEEENTNQKEKEVQDADTANESTTHFKTRDEMEREYRKAQEKDEKKDDWIIDAEKAEAEALAQAELEESMGGADALSVKLGRMADAAHSWADRLAYLRAFHSVHQYCTEDVMADIRDAKMVDKAEDMGVKDEYLKMRETRLRENMFLMDMVEKQGVNINDKFSLKENLAVKAFGESKGAWLTLTWRQRLMKAIFGEAKAEKYLHGTIYTKKRHGTPRLTSWGAVFGLNTLSSPKEDREMLKRLGIYKDIQRAEMLRRMANSFICPTYRPAKKFMGITIRKEGPKFRNWLHKKMYKSCMTHLANVEALIAWRCRQILAERDVHINGKGKAIYVPNADLYWRRDIDIEAYKEAVQNRGAERSQNQDIEWFLDRYGSKEEARKMQLELEVFDTLRMTGNADDYMVERQLKAKDEKEIQLWKSMNEHYHSYQRVKDLIDKIVESYENTEDKKKKQKKS